MTTPVRTSFDSSISLHSDSAVKSDLPNVSFMRSESAVPSRLKREQSESNSFGKDSKQNVPFGGNSQSSFPIPTSGVHALSRHRGSDPSLSRGRPMEQSAGELPAQQRSRLRSSSPSRAVSPRRILHHISSSLHLAGRTHSEDPFIPIDPFKRNWTFPSRCVQRQEDLEEAPISDSVDKSEDPTPSGVLRPFLKDCRHLFMEILAREIYLNCLLRIPAMYFARVARTFEDAEISRPDIQRMINASGGGARERIARNQVFETTSNDPATATRVPSREVLHTVLPIPDEWTPDSASPALIRFKQSWERFIDSLAGEWKTLNVVSALLASAILGVLQIPNAANDPVTRTGALLALISSLMSLTYGCMYIVRFKQMRSMFHASRWAEETRKSTTSIWWNVWVFLATPAVWLAWAMIWFIATILSFVWRNGSVNDPETRPPLSSEAALCVRIIITAAIVLGLVHITLIIRTLRKYGPHIGGIGRYVALVDVNDRQRASEDISQDAKDDKAVMSG